MSGTCSSYLPVETSALQIDGSLPLAYNISIRYIGGRYGISDFRSAHSLPHDRV